MINKKDLIKYLADLPDQFSIDELLDKLLLIQKAEKGLQQSKNNQITSHQNVKERLSKWFKH